MSAPLAAAEVHSEAAATSLASAPASASVAEGELRAVCEIAHAFLVADSPAAVFQFALDRVTPLLGAAFSLIMQLGADGELLRPVAQHEWPAPYRNWIGALRVRVGDGPSGQAVAFGRVVEIPDLFADPDLESWFEVARELGFSSIISAPLVGARGPIGAIAFYFTDTTRVSAEQRALVRVVADQLAATADKSVLIDELRRANAALADANAELERQAQQVAAQQQSSAEFVNRLTATLDESLRHALTMPDALSHASAIASAARELVELERHDARGTDEEIDPRAPLREAVRRWRSRVAGAQFVVGEPTVVLPTMLVDRTWLTRLLELMIGTARGDGEAETIRADITVGGGFVSYRLRWQVGVGEARTGKAWVASPFDSDMVAALAARLGGQLQIDDEEATEQGGADREMMLVLPVGPAH